MVCDRNGIPPQWPTQLRIRATCGARGATATAFRRSGPPGPTSAREWAARASAAPRSPTPRGAGTREHSLARSSARRRARPPRGRRGRGGARRPRLQAMSVGPCGSAMVARVGVTGASAFHASTW
jgi:hypothetical protein